MPYFIGLLIFAALNCLMLQYNWDAWTSPNTGFWTAFHSRMRMSGFDPHAYVTISEWRPSWSLFRHPLLAIYYWPLSELNVVIKDTFNINGAILVLATLWTLLATTAWGLLYNILHKVLSLKKMEALMLCLFFFSFAYVMLVTFVADHMLITLTFLLYIIYKVGMARKEGRNMKSWATLLVFFFATGVTTTNCVKIWLIDIIARYRRGNPHKLFLHSMKYIPVAMLLVGLYIWQDRTIMAEERESIALIEKKRMEKDKSFAQKVEKQKTDYNKQKSKQLSDSQLFQYTDTSIGILPSLVHNIFGEGLQLHSDHLLEDVNRFERPIIVRYTDNASMLVAVVNYLAEGVVVLLLLCGIWIGRRSRFMWIVLSGFIFDMFLHLGLCFALADVYIMTAHWAFVIPIAVAYILSHIRHKRSLYLTTIITTTLLTTWLWVYNLHLIIPYILS